MSNIKFKKNTLILLYGLTVFSFIAFSFLNLNNNLTISYRNIIFFCILGIFTMFLDFPNKIKLFIPPLFISLMSIHHFLYDPIQTPDSVGYNNILLNYSSYKDLFQQWLLESSSNLPINKGFVKFGMIFYPFHSLFGYFDEYFIAIFNSILMILSIYYIYKITKKHFLPNLNIQSTTFYLSFLVLLLFSSGNLYFYSTVFLKDITNLFVCTIALYFLLEKKYFIFFLLAILATYTRVYSIIIIGIYYLFIKRKYKLALLSTLFSLLYLFITHGMTSTINSFFAMFSLLISPNPFKLENWNLYFFRSLENLIITIGYILGAYTLTKDKESRKITYLFLLITIIYSAVMSAIGSEFLTGRNIAITLGTTGDNVARKKLPIIGITYMMNTYYYIKFLEIIKNKKTT